MSKDTKEENAVICGRMFTRAAHDAVGAGLPWPAVLDGLWRSCLSITLAMHQDHADVARWLRESAERIEAEARQRSERLQ